MVRAMKRQDLLNANGHLDTDATGNFKRRNSDERVSSSAPPGEVEYRDALVYVHKVQPQDTLAGITIKFNCQAAVLRKANRMWPNDSIQTRKTIVLPVDACGVKGRPVPGPEQKEEDLLLGYSEDVTKTVDDNKASSSTNGWPGTIAPSETFNRQRSSTVSSKTEPDPPWVHDSWVLFPNDSEPTEIARLPRRTLGYFPPARRKSITFSDANTPKSSFDLPRASITSSPRTHLKKDTSSSPAPSGSRPRTQSITSHFPLHGPGGVGTLGRNVRAPGPAQDGLNKFFAAHLPNVLPPATQEHFTPWTPALLEQYNNGEVLALTAGAPGAGSGGGFDLENMGGAIESWVRKMATKASKALNDPSSSQNSRMPPIPGLGAEGGNITDLIELQDDPFEIGDGEERDRERDGATVSQVLESTARPDLPEGMRGRDRGNSSRGKSKKSD
jgi:LysM repeat protein